MNVVADMKRVDYLSTLGVVTVLLIAEVKDTQTEFQITKPVYFCVLMRLLFNISYYSFFTSIVISLVSSLTALHTGTAARVLAASAFTFVGLAIYCLLRAMHDYAVWNSLYTVDDHHDNDGDDSTSQENTFRLIYLASVIPLSVCVAFLIPGSIYISYLHFVDRSNYKMMGVLFDERETLEFAKPLKPGDLPDEIGFRVYDEMLEAFKEALRDGGANPYDAARRRAREFVIKDPDRSYQYTSQEMATVSEGLIKKESVSAQRPAMSFAIGQTR